MSVYSSLLAHVARKNASHGGSIEKNGACSLIPYLGDSHPFGDYLADPQLIVQKNETTPNYYLGGRNLSTNCPQSSALVRS